jgi:hypothetical protein
MKSFDEIQKWLVEQSERAHKEGIRHAGLSGTICENLLMLELRKSVPKLNFDGGVIKFCKGKINNTKHDVSKQIDIIIYKGKPIYDIFGTIVVHSSQVLGAIEVTKWTEPKEFRKVVSSLQREEAELKNKSKKKLRLFYVTFRASNNLRPSKFKSHIRHGYCFYGRTSGSYPWEARWKNFSIYAGQYEKLVKDVKKLI